MNGGWGISYEITLRWMALDLTDDKSTLVQVMAWCHQATSHYPSQCWPRSMLPNGVTRPQWVNSQCLLLMSWCHKEPGHQKTYSCTSQLLSLRMTWHHQVPGHQQTQYFTKNSFPQILWAQRQFSIKTDHCLYILEWKWCQCSRKSSDTSHISDD